MKGSIERYFLFLFIFVFAISLVNISPLFAKKEKEEDKAAVDTDVCKRDTTKTGAEQYSAQCKEQCTSTDTKYAKFKADNKEACDLLQALTATTDKPAITKEQEIESLVQDIVEKLNKIEDTAENTAALEAIIPEFPSPTSKEFTITFSDKLKEALETIIFAQPALYNVLNETDKTPETAEKTPIQVRAEAAIKTIILKSFDPLTDTATGKYYKEVIQELRDHWLNLDLKGDATTKEAPFTVDNFKSAIFGSIGYSLPHELYHFEFDEALTKAINDNTEADTAKKTFVEAYKKYIETNTKIEIQSDTWKEGEPLLFKISLKAGDALLDPGTKCTDEKFAQFKADNAEVCKLVADANAKAATDSGTADANAKAATDSGTADANAKAATDSGTADANAKATTDSGTADAEAKKAETEKINAEKERDTAVSKSNEAKNATTSTDALAAARLSDTAANNADTAANNAETALTNAKAARDRIPTTDNVNRGKADAAVTAAEGFSTAARTASNEARGFANEALGIVIIPKAFGEAFNAVKEATKAATSTLALGFARTADTAADNAEAALKLIPDRATFAKTALPDRDMFLLTLTLKLIPTDAPNRATFAQYAADVRTAANEALEAVITKAKTRAEAEKATAETEKGKAEAANTSTTALTAARTAATAATNAATEAKNAKDALALIPDGAIRSAAETNEKAAADAAALARTSANSAAGDVITKARYEAANFAQTAASERTKVTNAGADRISALGASKRARTAATNADTSAKNAETALALIPEDTIRAIIAEIVHAARTSANEADASADAAEDAVPAEVIQQPPAVSAVEAEAKKAETEKGKAEKERDTAVSKSNEAKNATTSTDALAAAKLAEAALAEATNAADAADKADNSVDALAAAKRSDEAATRAETAAKLIPDNNAARAAAIRARTAAIRARTAVAKIAYNETNNASLNLDKNFKDRVEDAAFNFRVKDRVEDITKAVNDSLDRVEAFAALAEAAADLVETAAKHVREAAKLDPTNNDLVNAAKAAVDFSKTARTYAHKARTAANNVSWDIINTAVGIMQYSYSVAIDNDLGEFDTGAADTEALAVLIEASVARFVAAFNRIREAAKLDPDDARGFVTAFRDNKRFVIVSRFQAIKARVYAIRANAAAAEYYRDYAENYFIQVSADPPPPLDKAKELADSSFEFVTGAEKALALIEAVANRFFEDVRAFHSDSENYDLYHIDYTKDDGNGPNYVRDAVTRARDAVTRTREAAKKTRDAVNAREAGGTGAGKP